jgi:hypothetical protein
MNLLEVFDLSVTLEDTQFIAEFQTTPLAVSPSNATTGAGFITRDRRKIVRQSGSTLDVPKGTKVYVTRPGGLYKGTEVGGSGNAQYVLVGFHSPLMRHAVGFFPVSSIGDPNNSQTRAVKGDGTQEAVKAKLEQTFGANYKLISSAPRSSKVADLVCMINGQKIQFEIKGRDSAISPITLFNGSLRRGATPKEDMNELAGAFTDDNFFDFEQMIDAYRTAELKKGMHKERAVVGFPGDKHSPPSGKIPPQFRVTDNPALFARARLFIMNKFKRSGDHYLVIDNRDGKGPIDIYWTGLGKNILKAPPIPKIVHAIMDTYGEPYEGAMRVALKTQLDPSARGLQL